jgi:hypothetical protein
LGRGCGCRILSLFIRLIRTHLGDCAAGDENKKDDKTQASHRNLPVICVNDTHAAAIAAAQSGTHREGSDSKNKGRRLQTRRRTESFHRTIRAPHVGADTIRRAKSLDRRNSFRVLRNNCCIGCAASVVAAVCPQGQSRNAARMRCAGVAVCVRISALIHGSAWRNATRNQHDHQQHEATAPHEQYCSRAAFAEQNRSGPCSRSAPVW